VVVLVAVALKLEGDGDHAFALPADRMAGKFRGRVKGER
jgi:hypothetical protein